MNRWRDRIRQGGLGAPLVSFFVTFALSLSSAAFNSIEYSNRAQCAIDSESPAHSSWMILNSYNAQKLAHNFALSTGKESSVWVKKASVEFRLGVTHLTLKLMNKILKGELPLLPTNLKSETGRLQVYRSIVKNCKNRLQCPELSEYLSQLWKASDIESSDARLLQFSKIDHMSSADFIQSRGRQTKSLQQDPKTSNLSCYLVKNKSALQGGLEKSKPNESDFENIAKAWLNKEQHITNCFSQDPSLNTESTVLQLDIKTEDLNWKALGFDFWNTVKIMTSWAWRHTSSLNQTSQSFHQLFKSIVLEESMMLMPNGCRSLTPQQCDSQTLSENSIRELAKLEISNQEHTSRIPEGPEKKILRVSPPDVNRDILDIHRSSDLMTWVQNFQKNMTSARGLSKNRIQNNLQIMDRISSSVNFTQVVEKLNSMLQSSRSGNHQAQQDLYLVCQETRLALDDKLNFYQRDLEQTLSHQLLDRFNQNPARDPKSYLNYLKQISSQVLIVCDQAASERLTEISGSQLTPEMYRPWAQKVLFEDQSVTETQVQSGLTKALLLWNPSAEPTAKNILCTDELECFRTFIDSAMQVRSALMYASAFLTHSGEILSSSASNPYAELKACEIYDPWLKSKESFRNLVRDSVNTALFGWNYFPVYLDLSKGLPQVKSLNKVFESGALKFSPQIQSPQSQMNLMVDLGPLAGVPCSLSIANGKGSQALTQMPYYLTGVTLNYCDSKSELENRAIDAQTVRSQPQTTSKKCVGCTIGLVSAESAVSFYNSQALAPIKFSVQVFKTISNFLSARRDAVNIPQQAQVNPEYVARVFQQFNSIPSHCVDQLSKGLSCFQNLCAAQSAHAFERLTGAQVTNAILVQQDNESESYAYVETPLCRGEIRFSVRCHEGGQPDIDFRNLMSFEKDCQGIVKKIKQELK